MKIKIVLRKADAIEVIEKEGVEISKSLYSAQNGPYDYWIVNVDDKEINFLHADLVYLVLDKQLPEGAKLA